MYLPYTIEELRNKVEVQIMDRKSVRIDPKDLARTIIAFANADGGWLAIGIEDNGDITGVDNYDKQINEILLAPINLCIPSVIVETEFIEHLDYKGNPNHVLVMRVHQNSKKVVTNTADEAFIRIGDKSKKLDFNDRLQLTYAKGERYYEDAPIVNATLDDIDFDFVDEYIKKIGYHKSSLEYLKENNDFIFNFNGKEVISSACILLFGKNPQRFFPRARVRFVKFDGIEALPGREMNVIKDEIFNGKILDMVNNSINYFKTQIKEHTFLGDDGLFKTVSEYPEFCWKEIIVNAIGHRDYGIKGTDIQIKMFDDHVTVESPGIFAGTVKDTNLRNNHFSRNPKIMEFLKVYNFVQEFGEGVDRMYKEMESANLPEPEYKQRDSMIYATLKNKNYGNINTNDKYKITDNVTEVTDNVTEVTKLQKDIISLIKNNPSITNADIAKELNTARETITRNISKLKSLGILERVGSDRKGSWVIKNK